MHTYIYVFKSQRKIKQISSSLSPSTSFQEHTRLCKNDCSQLSPTLLGVQGAHPPGDIPAAKQRAFCKFPVNLKPPKYIL